MPHLWIRDDQGWAIRPLLEADAVDLTSPTHRGPELEEGGADALPPLIAAMMSGGRAGWAVFASAAHRVAVNGVPVTVGMRVLSDRDEIAVADRAAAFFSAEQLAAVAPLPPSDRAIMCARCRQPIEAGSPAVRCPSCGLWHHQTEPLPCWTHLPECGACAHPTDFDTSYRWTPEDL